MNFRFAVVEATLNRADFRWKWLKFLQRTFLLGAILCLLALLVGAAILAGWLTSKSLATTLLALIAIAGFVAWAVIAISVVAEAPDRSWLAGALERVDRRFLDRLNTLLFLERFRRDAGAQAFATRIAKQAQQVVTEHTPPSPFPASRPLPYLLAFLVVLTATLVVYDVYAPWDRLLAAEKSRNVRAVRPEKPMELSLPPTNNLEQNLPWGEVRITDPGTDLKVTKVDVVPLQIEAAANQRLNGVTWFSTINGANETPHPLPPPSEPRYAVYQPDIYLDELQLSDWDVLTYYAKASTEKQNSYASEVYFLEVRPFREDILKMPGGEGGKAYQTLNEISTLIHHQEHIIRQTHQFIQKPPAQENLQAQDRNKLSQAEGDVRDGTHHLYARMASEMENRSIGDALDNLAQAEKTLGNATQLLTDNVMDEARNRERSALSQLVAARKSFQKAVSDNPGAFQDPKKDEPAPPVADESQKLNQMAEFRNETKAAEDFMQKTLQQQKALEQQARAAMRSEYSKLSNQQQQLQKGLQDFQQQHPRVFKGAQAEAQQAQQAMSRASESLQQRSNQARTATQQATQALDKLSQAMKSQSAEQQLADAYKLKQMLDKQIQKLGQGAGATNAPENKDLGQTAGEARQTLNQLKDIAEQPSTRNAFGPPLREALSGQNKVDLDAKLMQLQQAQNQASKQQLAGQAKEGLGKVSRAFDASLPQATQTAKSQDALQPGDADSFGQGMAELDSLSRQLENNRQLSPEDAAKQRREALYNLQNGLRSRYGENDQRAGQMRAQLDQVLKGEGPIDLESLKKLMSQLQQFSVEHSEKLAKKEDKPEVTNIDPTRLPPAYRGRIQKYFQKLSE